MNALTLIGNTLPAIEGLDEALKDQMGGGDYLPYIILNPNSGKWTGPSEVFPDGIAGGNFLLVKNKKPKVLTKSMNVIPVQFRPLALKFPKGGTPDRVYDSKSPVFQSYMEMSKIRDHADGAFYQWGVEVLFYLLDEGGLGTMFFNNKTLRRVFSEQIMGNMRQKVTATSKYIKDDKYQWWGIDVSKCDLDYDINADQMARVQSWAEKFVQMEVASEPVEVSEER